MKLSGLILVLCLSCVSYPREVNSVALSNGFDFPLITDNSWGSFSTLQQVTVSQGARQYTFNVQVEVHENQMTLVGLTAVHSRSFLISYKNGILSYEEPPFLQHPVNPERMIADFQLIYAPSKIYHQQLPVHGLHLEMQKTNRTFSSGKTVLVSVNYLKNNKITLRHHGSNAYQLTLKTLDFEQL